KLVLEAYQDACLAEAAHVLEKGKSRDFWPLLAERRTAPAPGGSNNVGPGEAPAAHEERAVQAVDRLCRAAAGQKVAPPLERREQEQVEALRRLRGALAGHGATPPLNTEEQGQVQTVERVLARSSGREVKPPLSEEEQADVSALQQWMSTRAAARL